jgi:hypothetical protein
MAAPTPVEIESAAPAQPLPPVFSARFESECDKCLDPIFVGDEIRADGQGGYEHAVHCRMARVLVPDASPVAGRLSAADDVRSGLAGFQITFTDKAPAPAAVCPVCTIGDCTGCPAVDAFEDAEVPAPPKPKLNVSGQPKAEYEWHGKQNRGYLVKDPRTGDYKRYKNGREKGWTRATTFNKAASDQNALSEWGKRNVLIGASLRPGLVAKAHGMTHDRNRNELMSLVAQLEDAAGAKVSADWGTAVHELTERWDGGELTSLDDVPAVYRGPLKLYIAALKEHGLVPVPGLIERTVFVPDFDGVVGTFDRVYLHEPSGQYLIGDVKTGKTLEYGMDEIETQEWLYARGINLYGVYDWNTHTWVDELSGPAGNGDIKVSEQWGVVLHLPAQGEQAGTCNVVKADLQRGKRHAQVCYDVRVQRSNKPKPEPFTSDLLMPAEPSWEDRFEGWEAQFRSVATRADAGKLWQEATDAGVDGVDLDRLVILAQDRLKSLGVHS